MCSDEWAAEVVLVPALEVVWQWVDYILVESLSVERRMQTSEAGPIATFPLLGWDRYYSVKAIHSGGTWDRLCFTKDPVTAYRTANELAERCHVEVRV